MATRQLACINRCEGGRFEALNAPLYVDAAGRYLDHDASRATYVCAVCGSVALDVAAARREMLVEDTPVQPTLTCPACGTQMLPPEDDPLAALLECPMCGQRFTIDEGSTRLHRGGAPTMFDVP